MILIIAGTNRPDSLTFEIAVQVKQMLSELTAEKLELFSLARYQNDLVHEQMYEKSKRSARLVEAQEKYFIPADKWIVVSPEYNGSYPGVLKVLLDVLSIDRKHETFTGKKVGLVGISSGRAGNWLGMDQLTSVLNYLQMHVYPSKPALRQIESLINEKQEIKDQKTIDILKTFALEIVNF